MQGWGIVPSANQNYWFAPGNAGTSNLSPRCAKVPRAEDSMAEPQTIGRYKILSELGHGAMGAVYRAEDPMMDRTVAIKTILAAALTGPLAQEYRERFIREAKAAGRLSHPGIVTVYDVSEENGTPYLVMEFINGRSLASAMDSGERFSVDRIYELGQQIAEALGYAHRNGVVHRDVKPANILLTIPAPGEIERAKLADLGVAKLTATQITTTGQLLGTPAFMPPEQFTGVPIDGRADLFSLGVILYWIATGDKPFAGDTITAVSYKIVHSDPAPPRRINPAVPVALERIIMKCLEKDPAARYTTGEALAADLAAGRAGRELMQSGGVVATQRSTANAVLMPVANMDGDPNTTLDSTQRLQMAASAPPTPPPSTPVPVPAATAPGKPGGKLETPALVGIGLAVATLLLLVLFAVKYAQHQRELRAEQQAQAQAAGQSQGQPQTQPDIFAQAQPAQTDSSLAASDQSAAAAGQQASAQPPATNPATGDIFSNAAPPISADAQKQLTSKPTSSRTSKKQSIPAPQPDGNSTAIAQAPVTTPQPAPTPASPPPVAATSPAPASNANAQAQSNASPAQPPHVQKPEETSAADMAKLHIEDGSVPNAAAFVVFMDGKQLFERKPVAEGAPAPKEDDLSVPPGDHEFRVSSGAGGPQVTTSSKVKEKFFTKKKMILKIELRDSTTGKTLKKSSHLDAGKTEFLISVKAANLLGF
jgi:serine/threonine protein kinase